MTCTLPVSGRRVVLCLTLCGMPISRSEAQPLDVHLSTGAAIGLARTGVFFPSGVQAQGGVRASVPHLPVAFQFDGGWLHLVGDSETLGIKGVHATQWSAVLSVVWKVPVAPRAFARPYLLVGGGLHRRPSIDPLGLAFTAGGLHGGGGADFRVGGLRGFVEARYVDVLLERRDVEYLTLSLGVRVAIR